MDQKDNWRKGLIMLTISSLIIPTALTGCNSAGSNQSRFITANKTWEKQEKDNKENLKDKEVKEAQKNGEKDDDDIYVHHGAMYIPYRYYTGPMNDTSMMVAKTSNGEYVPYVGSKSPMNWTSNATQSILSKTSLGAKFSGKPVGSVSKFSGVSSGKTSFGGASTRGFSSAG